MLASIRGIKYFISRKSIFSMVRKALITGITGQDGAYLAELLLSKGYRVIGMVRRSSTMTHERISHILDDGQVK